MIAKSLLLVAAVASTPLCLIHQEPAAPRAQEPAATTPSAAESAVQKALDEARARLEAVERRADDLSRQLEESLDAIDATYTVQRDRNCSPTRSRALMSHYQWLRHNGHDRRADAALALVVEQTGNNADNLANTARHLMTDQETAGKFDDVALALTEHMRQTGNLAHHQLDTAAWALFLNGRIGDAVALQKQAVDAGGNNEEYRRRLRTYEAAKAEIARTAPVTPTVTAAAASDD